MRDLVSVIIPSYNSEKYIEKAIASVMKQTYKDLEIIICDDGSTDNSIKIYDKIQLIDKRVKVVKNKHQGPSEERNIGIFEAKGKYILFLDSDDWIESTTIGNLVEIYNNNLDIDIICFGLQRNYVVDEEIQIKKGKDILKEGKYYLENILEEMIQKEIINSPVNKMYKTEILKKYNIKFDNKLYIAEDLLFNINYFKYVRKVYISNSKFYNYRIANSKSLTNRYIKNKYEQLMYVNDYMKEWIKSFENEAIEKKCEYIRFKNIISCIRDLYHKNCNYTKKQKLQFINKLKKENSFIIIYSINIKIFMLSIIYSISPSRLLLILCKYI